jgi:hypothetical protein
MEAIVVDPGTCLEELRITTKNLRIADISVEIRPKYFSSMSLHHYRYTKPRSKMAHYVVSLQFQAINGTANQQP